MANYNWREHPQEPLRRRFPEHVRGFQIWSTFLIRLQEFLAEADTPRGIERLNIAFGDFVEAIEKDAASFPECRVFVSHQSRDVAYAERIAWLATQHGFEYWLDVHDPILTLANRADLPAAIKGLTIAAIIEIALLNCSHIVAVQTVNSRQSRWVPYEYGRTKHRVASSQQAASWFDTGVRLDPGGDYLSLGMCAFSERDVGNWLAEQAKAGTCKGIGAKWTGEIPTPLPLYET